METIKNKLPHKDVHNIFVKIIKGLFDDDFVFKDYKEDTWQKISSCRFKNIVFERNGGFEKYLGNYMRKNINYKEFSESNSKNWI